MALPRHRTAWAITLALDFPIFFFLDVLARGGGRSSDYTRRSSFAASSHCAVPSVVTAVRSSARVAPTTATARSSGTPMPSPSSSGPIPSPQAVTAVR